MATNPRIPEPPHTYEKHDHATMHAEDSKKRRFPVPLVILIVAAALLAAVIWFWPTRVPTSQLPAGAVVPTQPTGDQIQFTDVRLANSPVGNQVYLDAVLHNTGNTSINGVLVNVTFPGANGETAATLQAPVSALTGESNAVAEPLVQHPIMPGAEQAVRITIPNAPQTWNRELPGITVETVTAVSAQGNSAQPGQPPASSVTGTAPAPQPTQ